MADQKRKPQPVTFKGEGCGAVLAALAVVVLVTVLLVIVL
jgi:hypothetical protein